MPIRESEKHRYPHDWPVISQRIRERAGWRCEFCGVKNGALGGRVNGVFYPAAPYGEKKGRLDWPKPGEHAWCHPPDRGDGKGLQGRHLKIMRIVLTVAHLDHTPENCADDNLKALCQRCHLVYDARHHAKNARATRRTLMGCGDLFDQEENAQ